MKARWRVDSRAVSLAEQRLQLQHRSRVALCEFPEDIDDAARYRGIRWGKHDIAIDSRLCVWEAGLALWHELTHAQQLERDGDDFWKLYRAAEQDYEDQARENERLNALIPLAVPC